MHYHDLKKHIDTTTKFKCSTILSQDHIIQVRGQARKQSTVPSKITHRLIFDPHMQFKNQDNSHITHTLKPNGAQYRLAPADSL